MVIALRHVGVWGCALALLTSPEPRSPLATPEHLEPGASDGMEGFPGNVPVVSRGGYPTLPEVNELSHLKLEELCNKHRSW